MTNPIHSLSATIPESGLQPLVSGLWPVDLLEAASASRELVYFTHKMLQTAHLPETDAQRDDKLTAFGHTFVNGDISFTRAAACHDKIRQLLPELRKAFTESGVKLPEPWGIRVGSAVELAVAMWGAAKDKYFIPASGSKDTIAAGAVHLCLRGNHGPDVDVCRNRLKTLPIFDAGNLCWLIDHELGIAAQLRLNASKQFPPNPPSPFRNFVTHAGQWADEVNMRVAQANGQRRHRDELHQQVTPQEIRLNELVSACLKAWRNTGADFLEVEKRVKALAEPTKAILWWEFKAPCADADDPDLKKEKEAEAVSVYLCEHRGKLEDAVPGVLALADAAGANQEEVGQGELQPSPSTAPQSVEPTPSAPQVADEIDTPPAAVPTEALTTQTLVPTPSAPQVAEGLNQPAKESQHRFELMGNVWHVQFENEKTEISDDLDGLRIIARLLEKKHTPISALQLEGHDENLIPQHQTDAPILDQDAKDKLRQELMEINNAMRDVADFEDKTEYHQHEQRKKAIEDQLKAAVGLDGKDRLLSQGNEANKAADRVRKALAVVYERFLGAPFNLPYLVEHLKTSIRKETRHFTYRPNPPEPDWVIFFK